MRYLLFSLFLFLLLRVVASLLLYLLSHKTIERLLARCWYVLATLHHGTCMMSTSVSCSQHFHTQGNPFDSFGGTPVTTPSPAVVCSCIFQATRSLLLFSASQDGVLPRPLNGLPDCSCKRVMLYFRVRNVHTENILVGVQFHADRCSERAYNATCPSG